MSVILLPSLRMKRVIAISLLSLFLYTIIGFYLVFSFLNIENKLEMSNLLEQNELLQTIRIQSSNADKIIYYENGKEISYNGIMYDVKEKSKEGDCIVLRCIPDDVETGLLADLDDNVQNNIDTRSPFPKKQNNSSKISLNDYCVNTNRSVLPRPYHKVIFNMSNLPVFTFTAPISSPPPKPFFS